jgi:exosome complex component RRP42
LLSPPLSYPLPLLSLTTHLALLSARLPQLISEGDEDPLFNDDWEASTYLYPRTSTGLPLARPPATLLVMSVAENIVFDPSKEELAVAESVLAISVGEVTSGTGKTMEKEGKDLRVLAIRTIDPPSRLTPPGIPDAMNSATGGVAPAGSQEALAVREGMEQEGVWRPPRGGVRRGVIRRMIKMAVEKGGVAEEVFDALEKVEA